MTSHDLIPIRHSYPVLAAIAVAASLALTACGPHDGTVSAAPTADATPVAPAGYKLVPLETPVAPAGYKLVPADPSAAPAPIRSAGSTGGMSTSVATAAPAVPNATTAPAVRVAEPAPAPANTGANFGHVRAIDPIRTRPQGSGTGAVVGGVLGAVLGNQIGGGGGRAAATAVGAVGGAVVGNNVERNAKEGISGWRVRVEFDNGSSRTYDESRVGDLRVGDRVRVEGGQVRRV